MEGDSFLGAGWGAFCWNGEGWRARGGKGWMGGWVPFRSAPAQNARPSPVMMPTRKEGSLSSQVQRASSSMWPALLMQLSCLGRERVTRRMRGVGKEILVNEVAGGGVEKWGVDIFGGYDNVRVTELWGGDGREELVEELSLNGGQKCRGMYGLAVVCPEAGSQY